MSKSGDRRAMIRGVLSWGVPLLALVLLAAWFIGEFQSRHGDAFDWELAALVATAAGTTLLAAGTAWLASTTSREVTATGELVQLTRDEQRDAARPILVLKEVDLDATPPVHVIARIINAGRGPALWVRVHGRYEGRTKLNVVSTTVQAIHPGQLENVQMELDYAVGPPRHDEQPIAKQAFVISGDYLDRTEDESRRDTIKTGPKRATSPD